MSPARFAPLAPLAWILAASALPILLELVELAFLPGVRIAWRIQGIAWAYYALDGCVAWAVLHSVDPWLVRRGVRAAPGRLAGGLAALAVGTVAVYALLYGIAFPHALGRPMNPKMVVPWWMHGTAVVGLCYAWLVLARAARAALAQRLSAQGEVDGLASALADAERAALEAQIEPHFLFNTLAHVRRQVRLDAAEADATLLALIDYLERTLPALRRADWRVADECSLVEAYLGLMARRFGPRLRYAIELDPRSATLPLPALTVATLVENAVRHGLAHRARGGEVRIVAALADAGLHVVVDDDGVGLGQEPSTGTGLGLATVRARLEGAFGDAATLTITDRPGGGVRATVAVASAAHAALMHEAGA